MSPTTCEYRKAERQLRQALTDARAGLDQFCEPELMRLLAQCSLKINRDTSEASALLHEAVRMAERMQSPGQLRRLLADLRALDEPSPLLSPLGEG